MTRRSWLLGMVALVLMGALAGTVAAQVTDPPPDPGPIVPPAPVPVPVTPKQCYVKAYDMNGDGRVNEVDMNQWKRWFLSEACQQGAGACNPALDVDGNGVIEFADLHQMLEHWRVCVRMPWSNDLPPR